MSNIEEKREETSLYIVPIFRYKFSQSFMDILFPFSKIHQYDDRKKFKEAWTEWIEENADSVEIEVKRLEELDYRGDMLDKMFKSARYYFRKKQGKKESKERHQYTSVQKELLEAMNEHILKNVIQKDNDTDHKNMNKDIHIFKPSDGFLQFCEAHKELIKDEIIRMMKQNITDAEWIKIKIKKTYKNRYFIITNKIVKQ